MLIGELATGAGVGVETVRYYQRRGLLDVPKKPVNGVRRYGREHLRRLHFIRTAQSAGFTLEQIRELISLDSGTDRARVQELARERMTALNAEIDQRQRAINILQNLLTDCESGSGGACPIIEAFEKSPSFTKP